MKILKTASLLAALNVAFAVAFIAVQSLILNLVLRFEILPFDAYPAYTGTAVAVLTLVPLIVSGSLVLLLVRLRAMRNQF